MVEAGRGTKGPEAAGGTGRIVWTGLGLALWALTVPYLSGIFNSPALALGIILTWLAFPLIYAFVAGDAKGIGLSTDKLGRVVVYTLMVTAAYSLVRNGLIIFVPDSVKYIAASAIQVVELLKAGRFGGFTGPPAVLFPAMIFFTFLAAASNELFYRGFIFTRLRLHMNWVAAALISALLFGVYHYYNSGLSGFIMGVVVSLFSGYLMHRHNNVIAPVLFHWLQYIATILVFYIIL